MQPVTPTRGSSSPRKTRILPNTPQTPFVSPQKHRQTTHSPIKHNRQSFLSTPNPTPRHRKKNATITARLGDAFNFHTTTRTLFPPTPSTVGSGRTKDNVFKSPLKQRIEDSPLGGGVSLLESPEEVVVAKRKLTFCMESDEEDSVETPSTPESKIVTRGLAEKWADDIPEDVDDDGEVLIRSKKLVNPFVSDTKTTEFVLKKPSRPLEYVEFVNKKGEKIVKKAGSLETDTIPLFKKSKPRNLLGELKKEAPFKVYTEDE